MDDTEHSMPTPPHGVSTPQRPGASVSELSPPLSQHRIPTDTVSGIPEPPSGTSAMTPSGANANGKRPLHTIDDVPSTVPAAYPATSAATGTNGVSAGDAENAAAVQTHHGAHGAQSGVVHTHAPSGYTWTRAEDEPGYAWRNKRAQEECARAQEAVMKDRVVGNKYGDPCVMAQRELMLGYELE